MNHSLPRPFRRVAAAALLMYLGSVASADTQTSQAVASDRAYNWLVAQQKSTGLVDSFQDQSDICYTDDQAVLNSGV